MKKIIKRVLREIIFKSRLTGNNLANRRENEDTIAEPVKPPK